MNDTPKSVRAEWNMSCPTCKTDDRLDIQVHVLARLTADGTDTDAASDGSHEWDSESRITCEACGWAGIVREAETACAAITAVPIITSEMVKPARWTTTAPAAVTTAAPSAVPFVSPKHMRSFSSCCPKFRGDRDDQD